MRADDRAVLRKPKAILGAPFVDLLPPLRDGFFFGLAALGLPDLQQVFQHVGHVAKDRHIDLDHFVDRRRVNIDMRFRRLGAERIKTPRDPVIKARADVDHQIAAVHRKVCLVGAVHAQHAQPRRTGRRIAAQTHQGGRDGKACRLDQLAQQLAGRGARVDDAAAGVEQWALGFGHRLCQLCDHGDIAFDLRRIMRLALGLLAIGAIGELHILGDVDQHGTRTARGRDVERLVNGIGQLIRVLNQPVMLGAGAGDANGVRFLKAIGADHKGRDLARQHDDRDTVQQRVCQAGHGVGRARARCHQRHAGFAGGPGIAFGGVNCALFVADEHVLNAVLLKDLVIDRQNGTAGIAKDHLDPLVDQSLHHHFRASHRLCHRLVLVSGTSPLVVSHKKAPVFGGGAWGT